MSSDNHQDMLRQIAEMAREGQRDKARQLVEEILEENDENIRAWMWLYRLSNDVDEKRIALTTVLQLDPTNDRAQQALDRLEGRAGKKENEVLPGISRGQLLIFGGGGLAIVLVLLVIIISVVGGNNAREAADIAAQTAVVLNPSQTAQAAQDAVATETGVAVAALETQLALTTATPSPTNTRIGPPTLPATFTPTPSFTPVVTLTPLPPPSGVGGAMVAWGGSDVARDGQLPLALIDNNSGQITTISDSVIGEYATASDRNRLIFTRYVRDLSLNYIQFVNPSTGINEPLAARYSTELQFNEGTMAQFTPGSPDLMVFVAISIDNQTRDIYLFDYNKQAIIDGPDPVARLTTDEFTYTFPTISPDGTQVIAVREDLRLGAGSPATDLVLIDVATGEQTMLTNDGDAVTETMARWSPDGSVVVYAANTSENPNHDIFMRGLSTFTDTLNLTRTDDIDELYPVYDPQSRYIAYASNRRDNYDIVILDTQTNNVFQLTDSNIEDYYPGAWLP